MSHPRIGPPPSRLSKKQITAYLPPEIYGVVRRKVESEGETLQLYLGRAINVELDSRGFEPFITESKMKSFVRRNSAAQLRSAVETPATRRGRHIVAGWFERNEVDRLNLISTEIGLSIQAFAEEGFKKLLAGYALPAKAVA